MKWTVVAGLAVVLAGGCGGSGGSGATPSNPPPGAVFVAPAPRMTSLYGVAPVAPPVPVALPALPQGWAWPFDPARAAVAGLPAGTVFRPANVAALRAAHAANPQGCGSVEVAKDVWVAPLCGHLDIGRFARSRAPAAILGRRTPPAALPESIDLRARGLDGPVKHQQWAPVCWSFAFANVMENALRRAGRSEVIAPLHLIFHDEWRALQQASSGRLTTLETTWAFDPEKACKLDQSTASSGSCESSYNIRPGSYREDPALLAETQRMEPTGAYRIAAVQPLQDRPGDPDEIAGVLATGQAVYAAFAFNATAWSDANLVPNGTIADWEPDGNRDHAVTIVGYASSGGRRWFLLHNSWGPTWGDRGYAWVSAEMVRARIVDAWTITLADAQNRVIGPGTPPSPLPIPPPPPTPSVLPPPPPPPPRPNGGGRTHCSTPTPEGHRWIPVDDSICTKDERGSVPTLLFTCHQVSSAMTNCAAPLHGSRTCASKTVGGRGIAACCPAGVTDPADPRCTPGTSLHPKRPQDY